MHSGRNQQKASYKTLLNCRDLSQNDNNNILFDGIVIDLYHHEEEPDTVNRLRITEGNNSMEIAPVHGFSLMQAKLNDRYIFWDNPAPIIDPSELQLASDEININGEAMKGFTYIKAYTAGIELLGLDNWGMPRKDKEGNILVLHGEASVIPVEYAEVMIYPDSILVRGRMIYREFCHDSADWYDRGKIKYEVIKEIELLRKQNIIKHTDIIVNTTNKDQIPDWGYHITFRPENTAAYLVPSKTAENRGGGKIEDDFEIWTPSSHPETRIEKGVIHKLMRVTSGLIDNADGIMSMVKYPDGEGIAVATVPSPYYQTWFCSGGAGSKEFTYHDESPVLKKNWDGIGIEIGSSPLDHDCNICPDIDYNPVLKPGQSKSLKIMIELLDKADANKLENNIREYNRDRKKIETEK